MTAPTRPVLRYHGGKWRLAPWIISHFPMHRCYVEPFGGAASVLMRKPRCYAEVYNEADGEIVNLFRVLREPVTALELYHALAMTPFARDEFVLSYTPHEWPVEQARRTVVRSFMGFGSGSASGKSTGFRSNSNRSGTTPAHDWVNWPEVVMAFTARLRGVVIEHGDALRIIPQHDAPHTLFYVDPPYPKGTRSDKGDDYRHELTDAQHIDLANALHRVEGMVVLSGYACDLYDRELFADWTRTERAHLADGAAKRVEVLWLNPACVAALGQNALGLDGAA